jgi:hypothetical protein
MSSYTFGVNPQKLQVGAVSGMVAARSYVSLKCPQKLCRPHTMPKANAYTYKIKKNRKNKSENKSDNYFWPFAYAFI